MGSFFGKQHIVLYIHTPVLPGKLYVPDQRRISKIDLSDDYLQAIRLYASCADELKSSELYRNDLIEFVSYYVAAKAENFYKQALKDDSENRVLAAQRNLQQTVDLLMDVDRLLASHPLYRLEDGWNLRAIAEQLFRKRCL